MDLLIAYIVNDDTEKSLFFCPSSGECEYVAECGPDAFWDKFDAYDKIVCLLMESGF